MGTCLIRLSAFIGNEFVWNWLVGWLVCRNSMGDQLNAPIILDDEDYSDDDDDDDDEELNRDRDSLEL